MMQRWILVTGAAGYVGSVLCRQLRAAGLRVRGVDRLLFGDAGVSALDGDPDWELVVGDLCDPAVRATALREVAAVIHLAAIVGDPACKAAPEAATALMDQASRALHWEALAAGVERFIFASTCSNYGLMSGESLLDEDAPLQPQSHYARLKVGFEEYLLAQPEASPMGITILRFATAYGPSPRMRFDLTVNHFTRDMALGQDLLVFGQQQWRPYCHVADLAAALAHVLRLPAAQAQGVFNIGRSDENYTKAMIVAELQKHLPAAKVAYGGAPDTDSRNYRVAFDRAAERLGFRAQKTVPQGIVEVLDLLRSGAIEDPFSPIYQNC